MEALRKSRHSNAPIFSFKVCWRMSRWAKLDKNNPFELLRHTEQDKGLQSADHKQGWIQR